MNKFTEINDEIIRREDSVKMYPHPFNDMIIKVDVKKLSPRW